MKAYKLFKTKNNKLYPLYIYANEEIPMNSWINAKVGIISADGKHVKSKGLGDLALRPGFHLTEFPLADHIGKRQADGTLSQARDTVWCEVEFSDDIDYTNQVKVLKKDGNINHTKSCMKEIPTNGYYWFQTSPNATCRWLIAGAIKVNRMLSNEEVAQICTNNGLIAQKLA